MYVSMLSGSMERTVDRLAVPDVNGVAFPFRSSSSSTRVTSRVRFPVFSTVMVYCTTSPTPSRPSPLS